MIEFANATGALVTSQNGVIPMYNKESRDLIWPVRIGDKIEYKEISISSIKEMP